MNITELFIRRPVMTALVMMGILLFGIAGYRSLPVSDLPNIDFPTLQVQANLPGASPETMAASVATILERQFSTVPGLDSMTSSSVRGNTSITMQFVLDRNIDAASQDTQNAIAAVVRRLPVNMPAPPSVQKVNPADQPILFMGLNSQTISPRVVDEYAEIMIAPAISSINGVSQVNVFGTAKYAVHVQLDPSKMASYGIGIDEVEASIQRHNVNLPSGTLVGSAPGLHGGSQWSGDERGRLPASRGHLPQRFAGAPGRARRRCRRRAERQSHHLAQQHAVHHVSGDEAARHQYRGGGGQGARACSRSSGPSFRPPSTWKCFTTGPIPFAKSVDDVKFSLELAIVLVVLVIFLFLRNVSATLIPSLALPLSVVGHIRGHVAARLYARQPIAHGADAGGRVCGRRRHRSAGKYRAPHGNGQIASDGRPGWRPRNRLHHPIHDAVAGRRLHPRVLHGRHSGPSVPRVRGGHHGGDPDFRLRVAQPHAR